MMNTITAQTADDASGQMKARLLRRTESHLYKRARLQQHEPRISEKKHIYRRLGKPSRYLSATPFPAVLFIFITLVAPQNLSSHSFTDTDPLGPLSGRNLYAPHLPWFSFPAEKAAALEKGTVILRSSLSLLNEFASYPVDMDLADADSDGKVDDQDSMTALDYESTIWELGVVWQALPDWRFSADGRLHIRYPGFADTLIEGFHGLFGLSNAGRENFDRNRSYWNIRTSNAGSYEGSGVVAGLGDLDLRALWSFWERSRVDLAFSGAFKIPIGRRDVGYGSGYPDLGLAFIVDWRPFPRWAFYNTAGIIMPLGPDGRFMYQFIPAAEFRLGPDLSFLLQGNIQRSPVTGTEKYVHSYFGVRSMFSLPQIDLKIGVKGRSGRFSWQFYFEEDPLTWAGPDLVVFFGGEWIMTGR